MSLGEPSVRFDATLPLPRLRRLPVPDHRALHDRARAHRRRPSSSGRSASASFAVYVMTPAGPHDTLVEGSPGSRRTSSARFLPALLLHFFLLFPRPIRDAARPRRCSTCRPPRTSPRELALLAARPSPAAAAFLEGCDAVLVRLLRGVRRRRARPAASTCCAGDREDAEAEKQVRWIGLGVIVGLAPFLILSALPRAFGLESPLLSSRRRRAARADPARLRLRDPQVAPLGRRDLRPRGHRRRPAPSCSAA